MEWFGKVRELFPEVTASWTHSEAAERLVRHMRKTGKQTPVVIYARTKRESIAVDVLEDTKVAHCMKGGDPKHLDDLIRQVRELLPATAQASS